MDFEVLIEGSIAYYKEMAEIYKVEIVCDESDRFEEKYSLRVLEVISTIGNIENGYEFKCSKPSDSTYSWNWHLFTETELARGFAQKESNQDKLWEDMLNQYD